MREEVKDHIWVYRMAIEFSDNVRGGKVSLQTLPISIGSVRQLVDQASNQLCVARLARFYVT